MFGGLIVWRKCDRVLTEYTRTNEDGFMWYELITELQSKFSEKQIADRVGLQQSSLNRLKNGRIKEPLYSKGAALVELHRKTFGRRRAE